MAACGQPTPHGARIGLVYTPPKYRQKGYASACVATLSQRLLYQGYKYCFLFHLPGYRLSTCR
jgi:predicted GNAT family acetyltransferase